MNYRLFLAVGISMALAGCATGSGKKLQSMENKIDVLEAKVSSVEQRQSNVETQVGDSRESVGYLKGKVESAPKGPATVVVTQGVPAGASAIDRSVSKKPLTNKQIQIALKNAGFYDGPIDGQIGRLTRAAIREFQKANDLKVDGKVGKRTRSILSLYVVR